MDSFRREPPVPGANWRVVCTTPKCGFKTDAVGDTMEEALLTVRHQPTHDVVAIQHDYSQHPAFHADPDRPRFQRGFGAMDPKDKGDE